MNYRGLDWVLDERTASGLRYATSKRNTSVTFMREGDVVDDTWRVTVRGDGVPSSCTTTGERAGAMLQGLLDDGFNRFNHLAGGRIVEVWCI